MPAQSRYRDATGQRVNLCPSESGQATVMFPARPLRDDACMRLIALLVVLVPVLLLRTGIALAEEPSIVEAVWSEPAEFPPDTAIYTLAGPIASGGFGWSV